MTGHLDARRPTPAPAPPGPRDDRWLVEQAQSLLAFARPSVRAEGGFWWLDDAGRPDPDEPLHTWVTCRMTHVFALAHLGGEPTTAPIVDHGVDALDGLLHDARDGGWFTSVAADGTPVDATKAAYTHAFVLLAASSAVRAGRPGADRLLARAMRVVRDRFWDDVTGRVCESWDAQWSTPEPYRGANSSMHMVEAFLATGDATGDPRWFERARRICGHLVHQVGAAHEWRLPEHFTPEWEPWLDYNVDRPTDPFRPYGSTAGHWLEWSRLLLHLETALPEPPRWLLDDARALFSAAVERGWAVDGAEGFVYTLDWQDRPVVRSRMHWVAAEALAAAAALRQRTGEDSYDNWHRVFSEYARRYLVDGVNGGWHHELDADNRPTSDVWRGKPDVYHAYQAVLIGRTPLGPSIAGALAHSAPATREDT